MMTCPICGGDPNLLGHLGQRSHYRCRACGWTWTPDRIEFDVDQEDDSEEPAPLDSEDPQDNLDPPDPDPGDDDWSEP